MCEKWSVSLSLSSAEEYTLNVVSSELVETEKRRGRVKGGSGRRSEGMRAREECRRALEREDEDGDGDGDGEKRRARRQSRQSRQSRVE